MNAGEVFEGLVLCAWGVAFYALARWQVRDDSRMRRMAESRWRLDRFFSRKLRRGEISKDEHFDSVIRTQRLVVRWAFTPVIALWVAGSVGIVIHGLAGP
jgi:urease alpha subunit